MKTDKDREDRRARQTAAQRRYAKRLKEKKAPRRTDLARALIHAARTSFAGGNLHPTEATIWTSLIDMTVNILVSEGFSRKEVRKRLLSVLHPQNPISR